MRKYDFQKLSSFLTIAILSLVGFKTYAAEVHGVFCGSELRPNYVEIADKYMEDNPGVINSRGCSLGNMSG